MLVAADLQRAIRPTTPYLTEMPEGLSASWKVLSQHTVLRGYEWILPTLCFRSSLKGRLESRDLKVTSRDPAEGQYEHRAVGTPGHTPCPTLSQVIYLPRTGRCGRSSGYSPEANPKVYSTELIHRDSILGTNGLWRSHLRRCCLWERR